MSPMHPRLRTRSLSDSDRFGRPQPAKFIFDAAPRNDASNKRATMPRAASAMNLRAATNIPIDFDSDHLILEEDPESAFRDIAREQVEKDTIRELAHFFRTTAPPPPPRTSSTENCFGKSESGGDNRRWSLRSFKRGSKVRPRPLSLQFRDSVKTTAAGNPYIAISVPAGNGSPRASIQSRLSIVLQQRSSRLSHPSGADRNSLQLRSSSPAPSLHVLRGTGPNRLSLKAGDALGSGSRPASRVESESYRDRASYRAPTPDPSVRSLLKIVDEWLDVQETEAESEEQNDKPKTTTQGHKSEASTVTLLTPTLAEHPTEHEVPAPKIMLNPALRSPTASPPMKLPEPESALPVTPPAIEIREMTFPETVTKHRKSKSVRPQSAGAASTTSPKALSPFPNTRSPKQQQKLRPTNILVKNTLEIPKCSPLPESPGFPMLLAAMTFPSPPESVTSHSATNSLSSNTAARPPTAPAVPARGSSLLSNPPTTMDQRIMPEGRPPLRHYKSDGAAQSSYMSHGSIVENLRSFSSASTEVPVDAATRSHHRDTSPTNTDEEFSLQDPAMQESTSLQERSSDDNLSTKDNELHRQSDASTRDSSWESPRYTNMTSRLSMTSDTSATSDATETTEVFNKGIHRNKYRDSTSSTAFADEAGRMAESKRSETPTSIRSFSSASTSATATSLAERRMARRNRLRENIQRDLEASKARSGLKLPSRPGIVGGAEAMDSPVLGWFPQNAPHNSRRTSMQGPSPLALANRSTTPDLPSARSDLVSRRSSIQNITQLIPETVQEVTPEPARFTFSPIISEQTEPDMDPAPALTLSPIMVGVSMEAGSPTSSSSLRPLSLLTNTSSSPPVLPPRSSLRPRGSVRHRPLPVRVSKNPLELTVNTSLKSKRNSSPSVPTPPMSPETSSASPRHSVPMTGLRVSGASLVETQNVSRRSMKHTRSLIDAQSKDSPTQWLTAHQRQTAQDWRLAALKDRMRRQKADEEAASSKAMVSPAEDSDEGPGLGSDRERWRWGQRDKHVNSSLRSLNANSTLSGGNATNPSPTLSPRQTPNLRSSSLFGDSPEPEDSRSGEKDVEKRLLRAIMPLLENMSNTLREMQRQSVNPELSIKFMDSMLAMASPLADGGGDAPRVVSHGSSLGPSERGIEDGREVPTLVRAQLGGRDRNERSLSLPMISFDAASYRHI